MYSELLSKKFLKQFDTVIVKADVDAAFFGIINLTPDSFSDGSERFGVSDYQLQKINEHESLGADVIDIGAESTRPYAKPVSAQDEFERLLPFLENYSYSLPLSIDTRKAEVIRKVFQQKDLSSQINYVNDVSGMQEQDYLEACAKYCPESVRFIAMHSKGSIPPEIAAKDIPNDFYDEAGGLEKDLFNFFEKTIELSEKFAIKKERLILDPGFGFAKNFTQSFQLIDLIPKLKSEFALPIFVGTSRKSFLKLWSEKISELGFDASNLSNFELDILTYEFNSLLKGVDYFRMHA